MTNNANILLNYHSKSFSLTYTTFQCGNWVPGSFYLVVLSYPRLSGASFVFYSEASRLRKRGLRILWEVFHCPSMEVAHVTCAPAPLVRAQSLGHRQL